MHLAPSSPGPQGNLVTGHLPELLRERTGFLARCASEHGDVVPLRFGHRRAVLISHPDLIEDVLVTRHRLFPKPYALRLDRVTFDNGRHDGDGDAWRRRVAPAFTRHHLAGYADAMVACTERRLETWQDGETREIGGEMMSLTLEIIATTLFAADVTDDARVVSDALEELMEAFFARLRTLFLVPTWLPTPDNRRRQRAAGRVDAFVSDIIDRRRAAGASGEDLLSVLLRAQRETPQPFTDEELCDEVTTLLLAGHETTALALTWAWHLLAQHPTTEAKLVTELQAVLDGRPATAADRPRLRYTEGIVNEALRLYPPLWVLGRVATAECMLGGHRVAAGTIILISPWVAHRDPRYFPRPEAFEPERWMDGLARRLPRYAYFPFGGGPRVCIGAGFAVMEAVLLLATIARRFRLTPAPGHPVAPRASITLRATPGVPMLLQRR